MIRFLGEMETKWRALTCFVIVIALFLLFCRWLWRQKADDVLSWWNEIIQEEDELSLGGIASLRNAWDCPAPEVTSLHRILVLYHDEILAEVKNAHYIDVSFDSMPEADWDPLWLRIRGQWLPTSNQMTTLKQIINTIADVENVFILFVRSGAVLERKSAPSRAFYRYIYGLSNLSISLNKKNLRCHPKDGLSWESTVPFGLWNETETEQIAIVADVRRPFSPIFSLGTDLVHWLSRSV